MSRLALPTAYGIMAVLTLAMPGVAIAGTTSLPAPSKPLSTSVDMNSPTTFVPDDDNVAEELRYPWQNITFWRDEQRQIGYMVALLALASVAGITRKALRLRRYAGYSVKDAGSV